MNEKYKVAFVCVHNSCRSQIAEALGKYLVSDVFECYSAGTETKPQINQDAVRIVKDLYGIDMEKTQYSKLLGNIPTVDIVVTMGCNVECPNVPCSYREDWGLEDPTGKADDEFVKIIKEIENKLFDLRARYKMPLTTQRLILRPWLESDAEALYEYAKNPQVGPIAGWPQHTSVENSREIIRDVLSADETYAVVLKSDNRVVGSVGLMIGEASNLNQSYNEGEIGYWIGVPFWGQRLIPEAVNEMLRHGFDDLGLDKIWCGYFDGNNKSKRVQEKCGFVYHHTNKDIHWELMDDIRTEHISCMTRKEYQSKAEHYFPYKN